MNLLLGFLEQSDIKAIHSHIINLLLGILVEFYHSDFSYTLDPTLRYPSN
jgi:hypothetical protein